MAELIVQYGYVTLFVIAMPLTPFLALLNNILEMKVDAFNLVNSCQRPHPNVGAFFFFFFFLRFLKHNIHTYTKHFQGSYGLGAWNSVLQFFSLIAVATNVAIITFRTELVKDLLEPEEETQAKWVFFVFFAVLLSLIVSAEKYLIPDVPTDVQRGMERQVKIIFYFFDVLYLLVETPNQNNQTIYKIRTKLKLYLFWVQESQKIQPKNLIKTHLISFSTLMHHQLMLNNKLTLKSF